MLLFYLEGYNMGKDKIFSSDARTMEYQQKISLLIEKLNSLSLLDDNSYQNELKATLQQIRDTDRDFVAQMRQKINGHVLFSRHGTCTFWEQKKWGLNPNAALADEAVANLSATNQSTSSLLHYPDKPLGVAVSPLVRAKQTASLVIPQGLGGTQITIEPSLSENSHMPSGINLTSPEQFNKEYQKISFWKAPVKFILFMVSRWIYGNSDVFAQINAKSSQADDVMLKIPGVTGNEYFSKANTNAMGEHSFDTSSLSEQGKTAATRALIHDKLSHGESDFWLFGHGKNFKSFFKQTFGIRAPFEYGETRNIYNLQNEDGENSLFCPSYTFVIDQTTGRIRGKLLDTPPAFEINPLPSKSSAIIESTAVMHKHGLAPAADHSLTNDLAHGNTPAQALDTALGNVPVRLDKTQVQVLRQPAVVDETRDSAPHW